MMSAPFSAANAQALLASLAVLSICVAGLTLMLGMRQVAGKVFLMGIFLAFSAALVPTIIR